MIALLIAAMGFAQNRGSAEANKPTERFIPNLKLAQTHKATKTTRDGQATIVLVAGDVWGDGSGYQLLLDADATAYGTVFPESGPLTTSGNASAEVYAAFEYKIPENADGSLTTTNIVNTDSIAITVPAGVYDYVVTNPTPDDRVWIAGEGRADDYEFLADMIYVFRVAMDENQEGDEVTVEIIPATTDPIIIVNPTELSFFTEVNTSSVAKTVNVRGYNLTADITATVAAPFEVSADNTTFGTTATLTGNGSLYVRFAPTAEGEANGTITISSTGATDVTVTLNADAYVCNPITTLPFVENFEDFNPCWIMISNNTANADEFGVYQVAEDNMVFRFSSYASADDYTQILITPELNLAAENTRLTFDYAKSSGSGEKFIVMVSSTDNDTAHFTMLGDTVSAASTSFEQYSSMIPAGTKYIAIKYVSSYLYRLYVDNFKLEEVFANDIAVVNAEFTNMQSCEIESTNLNVTVRNNGLSNITAFSIEYSINEGTPAVINVADTVINPDSTFVVTIENIDVSTAGTYNVEITAVLDNDGNMANNTGAASIRHTTPSALPFVESFDEGLDNYNIINADEDEATWNVVVASNTDYALYIADGEADDYILTNCINFEEANIYEISFDYLGGYNYYDYFMFYDNIEILYGTSQDVEEMTVIDSIVDIYEPAFVEYNKRFTIATAGTYYFAIHCYSEDGARVAINNLKINMIDPYEASISNLTFGTPSGCGIESSTLSATITNNGSAPLTAFTAAYKVNDNEPVSQEFTLENALAFDSTYVFTFETPIALAEVGEYDVVAYITLAGDENHTNDTVAGTIEKMVPEIELTSIVPADEARIPFAESINIAGTITNNSCALTSYIVTYKVGEGEFVANDTIECNVAEGATHNFTHSVPFTPEATGEYTITVKVSKPNDTEDDADDNELTATFTLVGCSAITEFPFEEGFENGMPDCWTTIDADGDGYGWILGSATDGIYLDGGDLTGAGHEESTDMMVSGSYSNVSGALTPDNWLITPAITLPAGSPASVSFFAAAQDADWPEEHYGVYVSTTTTDPAAFTLIWDETMDENGGQHRQGAWGEKHAELSNYAGQTIYIGFRHYGCTDNFILLIDDITVALVSAAEENIAEAIEVYPNPTSSMVTIANAEGKDIVVINSLGQVVASIENAAANQTIDVSSFANGTYFVKVDAEVVKLNVVK